MYLNLSLEKLERIIDCLKKDCQSNSDRYLINYLETVKKNWIPSEVKLDEIPF
jgi:hypothetical protein